MTMRKIKFLFGATAAALIGLVPFSPVARANILFSGWYFSSFAGPLGAPLESAAVAEGILYDTVAGTAGAPTYDYIFLVANTGLAPIAAFGGGTGSRCGAL
jgi:hypothetical protein